MFVSTGHFFRDGWHNYADLRGVRKQNHELQDEVTRLQMEQVRLKQDADQARRLQALLEFKEKFISRTVAAQVIGTSGSEQSRVLIIDKGSHDGIKTDMAVITPDGIVGKVKDVFPLSAQVLLINDHDSGAGVILERSRLQGIVKGTSLGELQINDIMSDEKIEAGDHVITSGGDRIYPKGYSVGTVINAAVDRDNDPFLVIKIKPAADLRRLEEVMVVTKIAEEAPTVTAGPAPMRAADILAQRLPSVPKQDANAPKVPGGTVPGAAPGQGTPGGCDRSNFNRRTCGQTFSHASQGEPAHRHRGRAEAGQRDERGWSGEAACVRNGHSKLGRIDHDFISNKAACRGYWHRGKSNAHKENRCGRQQTGERRANRVRFIIPAPTKKTGVEGSKPASSGQTAPVPAGATGPILLRRPSRKPRRRSPLLRPRLRSRVHRAPPNQKHLVRQEQCRRQQRRRRHRRTYRDECRRFINLSRGDRGPSV